MVVRASSLNDRQIEQKFIKYNMNSNDKKEFTGKLNPNFKGIVEDITAIIGSVNEKLSCEIKWGRLTYGLNGDFHHWICGIAQTKKSVNLIFHFGGILEDKNKYFIIGDSFFLRKLEYTLKNDIDEKVIKNFVKQAIDKLEYFKANWKLLNKKKDK